jgi:hypothetical protein
MLKPLPRLKNSIFNNNSEVNSDSLVNGYIKNIFESGTITVLDIRILLEPSNYSNIFENNVKSYLKSINKEMKVKVKTGHFTIVALNDFLLDFHNKISFLLNILIEKLYTNNIVDCIIKDIFKNIITDSIIKIYIENVMLNFEYKNDIHKLFEMFNNFSLLYTDKKELLERKLWLRSISNMYISSLNTDILPIPQDLQRLQNFYNLILYYHKISNYLNFINDDLSVIIKTISNKIIDDFIEIIKKNSFEDIYSVLNENVLSLISKDQYMTILRPELIMLINKTNNDNFIIILKIMSKINNVFDNIFQNYKNNINFFLNDKIIDKSCYSNFIKEINIFIKNNQEIPFTFFTFIVNYLSDYDLLFKLYYESFCERVFCDKIHEYDTIFIKIHTNKTNTWCNKIRKIIDDRRLCKQNILYTSMNSLPINYNDCAKLESLHSPNMYQTVQSTYIYEIAKTFEKTIITNKSQEMCLLLHYGEVKIDYNDKEIILLPIQYAILELFHNIDELDIDIVMNKEFFSHYSEKFKKDIILSFQNSGLFKMKDNKLKLSKSIKTDINLIEIFLSNNEYFDVSKVIEEEFVHDRIDIIKTLINHNIKLKPLSYQDLFTSCASQNKVFTLEDDIFKKAIDYMIEHDYIELKEELYYKLFY